MRKIFILSLISIAFLCYDNLYPQWNYTNGPYGGRVQAFATSGSYIFAGMGGGGVYVSTDNGSTWSPSNSGLFMNNIYSFVINNSDIFCGGYGGVYLSTDNGASWEAKNTGLTTIDIKTMTISGVNIFAAGSQGVYRTTDNGNSWTQVVNGLSNSNVNVLGSNGSTVFAGTFGGGVFRTTNAGANWIPSNNGITSMYIFGFTSNGSYVYAGGETAFRSSDNGSTWIPVNNGLTSTNILSMGSNGSTIFAGTSGGLFLSANNGDNWAFINNGIPSTNIFTIHSSGSNVFSGEEGGVYLSTDNGASWDFSSNGIRNLLTQALAVLGSHIYCGSWGGGVNVSTDNGTSWTQMNSGITNLIVSAFAVMGTNIMAGTQGGIFKSTDFGNTWFASSSGLTDTQIFSMLVVGNNLYAGSGSGVFLSTDIGISWTRLSNTNPVYSLAEMNGNLFAGTWGMGAFMSTDGGQSWSAINNGLADNIVMTLAVIGNTLFAGTTQGVHKTTDNGSNWTLVNNGLTIPYILSLRAVETNLFAGSWGAGVFLTTDMGTRWISVSKGLTNMDDRGFTVFGDDLYLATIGGVWKRPLSEMIPTTTFQLTVNVMNGWNMVSIPGLHPANQDVTTWWPGKDPTADVFKYNGSYQPITTAAPTEGYWMKNDSIQTYNTGDEWPAGGINIVSHDLINGNAGWNLIGGYEYNAQTSGITTNPGGLIQGSIYGYSGGYNPASELVPGYGYWIKLSGAGQIVLPPPTFKGTSKIAEYINEDWGKIIITDNAGRSYTLYAVSGEVNLKMFDLPPVPPSGMFDVRYSSGRYAEDLNKNVHQIEMNGMVYPVKIKAENIDIRLQDETGREVNVELRAGEEITINNSSINALIILSSDIAPVEYTLEQNYPNPFNPSTEIVFHIAQQGFVTLKVYDLLGSEVKTLVNEELSNGIYKVDWNGDNEFGEKVSSGIYFYRIETGGYVNSRKMLLIK